MASSSSLLSDLNLKTTAGEDLIAKVEDAFEETEKVLADDPNSDLLSQIQKARKAFATWKASLSHCPDKTNRLPQALEVRDLAMKALGRVTAAASHIYDPEADRDDQTTEQNVVGMTDSVRSLIHLFPYARLKRIHDANHTSPPAVREQPYYMSPTLEETTSDPGSPSIQRTTKPLSPSNTNIAASSIPSLNRRTESQHLHKYERVTSDEKAKVYNGNIINDLETYVALNATSQQDVVLGHNYGHVHAGGNSIVQNGDYYGPGSPFSSSQPTLNDGDTTQLRKTGLKRQGTSFSQKLKFWESSPKASD